ncbi:MAG: hypothetical protein WCS43_13695 [Verrucomicrobiota bacterium]
MPDFLEFPPIFGKPDLAQLHSGIILAAVIQPEKDRSHWPVAKLSSFDEVRAYRINQWQQAGPAARLAATWELVTDYWVGMKGKEPDELRLQRSVTHFCRTPR